MMPAFGEKNSIFINQLPEGIVEFTISFNIATIVKELTILSGGKLSQPDSLKMARILNSLARVCLNLEKSSTWHLYLIIDLLCTEEPGPLSIIFDFWV